MAETQTKNEVGKFYMPVTQSQLRNYLAANEVPAKCAWASVHDPKTGFGTRVIHQLEEKVREGTPLGRYDKYVALLSLNATYDKFRPDGMISEMYQNLEPVPMTDLVVEEISPTVAARDLRGLKLSERVEVLLMKKSAA